MTFCFALFNKKLERDLGEDTIENEQILQTLWPLNFAYTKIFPKQKLWKCFLTASLGHSCINLKSITVTEIFPYIIWLWFQQFIKPD